jgi:hypothetical protein
MPLKSVEELLFCEQDFDADDIINNLVVEYDNRNMESEFTTDCQRIILSICKNTGERHGGLIDVLRDRCKVENNFLRDFVWFITGSYYIQRSTLKIKVEFNYEESFF